MDRSSLRMFWRMTINNYVDIMEKRLRNDVPLFMEVAIDGGI